MKKKLTSVLLFLAMSVGVVSAQTSKVTGKVVGEDGEPVIGASIIVKGTTVGTVTDFDGNFTLDVPSDGKQLVISYIGMKSKEVVVSPNVNVTLMSDTQNLDEVVVTAMGISKEKKALGYAVQDVKSDELTQGANTSLSGALQGKVSGIDIASSSGMPGASSKIMIRGARSFTGDNSPLYVIDGMPIASTADVNTDTMNNGSVSGADYANRAVDLDPNDIESINILKGQAASALYGMRASNGVIVITTKSGKGARKGKPQISFNTNLAFDKVSTLPELQTEYGQGNEGAYNPYSGFSWGPSISDLANDPVYGGNVQNEYTKGGLHNGQYYVPQRAAAGLDPWATPQAYNNAKDFFQTGVTWSNSVNVAQSFDKGNYSFSLGNTTSDGIVRSTGMDRYNVKLSGEAQLHDNWTTGFNGNFVTSKIKKQGTANDGVTATVYTAPISYTMAGIPSHIEGDPYTQNTFRENWIDDGNWACDNNSFTERSQRFFGNAFLKYSTKFGTDNHKLDVKYQIGDDAYTTNYSDIYGYGTTGYTNGYASEYGFTVNEMNSLLTFTYNWNINEDFVFDALLGNELVDKRKFYESYGANYNFPGWNHIDNATTMVASESLRRKRTVGNFASISLSYANMVYFNATVRNDIVSNMPRNNRSFTYPSVSLGWIFTELEPLKNNVLTYGKLRASYAEVGQAGDYYDSYYTTPVYGGGFYGSTPIQYPMSGITAFTPYARVYDPNLKPQNTKSYELGVDLTFLNGLFSLNYTFSRQNVKDQIFEVPLAGSTGSAELVTNGGAIHTNAHEITLGINPINTKNFKWDMAFNFSKIDNYVDELAPGVESIFLGGFVDPQVRANIGDKFPVIYGTTFLRNDNGDIVVDEDGLPQIGSEGVIGKVSPDFLLGFNTNFEIYKFRIGATFDWKCGGQMYSGTLNTLNYYGTSMESVESRTAETFRFSHPAVKQLEDGSYVANDIDIKGEDALSYYDRMTLISEAGIYDSGFLKLRELSVSYPIWDKNGINVNLNVFARNIILWSELKGLDPEASQGNNNMGGGFERFSMPGASSYGFGLNVKF